MSTAQPNAKSPRVSARVRKWLRSRREKAHVRKWEQSGRPAPPPHSVKQSILRTHAQKFGTKILVETGTFMGDMVEAMKHDFEKIYSIELSEDLYRKAQERFQHDPQIELIQGDSGQELESLVQRIDQPSLFWLDGHYSAGPTARGDQDTPIISELSHILDAPVAGHVVLIDDARCFGTELGYPELDQLKDQVCNRWGQVNFRVEDDIVRIISKDVAQSATDQRRAAG